MSGVGEHGQFVSKAISKIQLNSSRNGVDVNRSRNYQCAAGIPLGSDIPLSQYSEPVLQGALRGQK